MNPEFLPLCPEKAGVPNASRDTFGRKKGGREELSVDIHPGSSMVSDWECSNTKCVRFLFTLLSVNYLPRPTVGNSPKATVGGATQGLCLTL